jgi:hypothetical protein
MKRFLAACRRFDRNREAWIAVAVLLGWMIFDSLLAGVVAGAIVWAAIRKRPRG